MTTSARFLLLQVRNENDPMRPQEVRCFADALGVPTEHIRPFNLLGPQPTDDDLASAPVVLIGGSGQYSATDDDDWLPPILDTLRRIVARQQPTFASCWGHQALARALGGRVVHDAATAEIGPHELTLTPAGREDAIFGPLALQGETFVGLMGHEDSVVELPESAVLLASSPLVRCQAYRLDGLPIYATQFHPELDGASFLQRLVTYPEYVERIAGVPLDEFATTIHDTPEAAALLRRFVDRYAGDD